MPGDTTAHHSRSGDPTANTLIERLVEAWEAGSPVPLAALLPPEPAASMVADVACQEIALKLQAGRPVRVADYLARYPQVAASNELVLYLLEAEVLGRKKHGPPPTLDEYLGEFPQFRAELERHFVVARPALPESPTGYELLEEIGRGGMGVIYRARDKALKREVAIKVLQDRFAPGSSVGKRFLEEAQITGQLQHPGIPAIHQVGTLADGRPFLAMKLIRGQTLAALIKSKSEINTPGVFEAICQAVGYAHERGVIHRDLKPENVMVGAFGEVQVMDWGLAKYIGAKPSNSTAESQAEAPSAAIEDPRTPERFEQTGVAGTPWYMAPEQAAGEQDNIDTRTDVFALGGILCAMLTAKPPIEGADPKAAQVNAARGETAAALARLDASGAELELVALCKRCLAFRPENRPDDASGVAAAVATFRNESEARAKRAEVEKAEASVHAAELRKRQRQFGRAAGVVVAVLLGGLGVSLWQMNRAIVAEGATARERDDKGLALQQAERNLEYSRKSNAVLGQVFADLDPWGKIGTLGELRSALKNNLWKAVADLEGSAIGDPLEVAAIQDALGQSLLGLGEPALAVEVLAKAHATRLGRLGRDHPDTLASTSHLALGYHADGRFDQALWRYEEVLDEYRKQLGPAHRETLTVMNNLALGLRDAGQLDRAVGLFEQALQLRRASLGAAHPDTLTSMNNLALGYRALGQSGRAMPLLEEAFRVRRATFGEDHLDTLTSMNDLAEGYRDVGEADKALPLLEDALRLSRQKLGRDHPDTLTSQNNLGTAYREAGDPGKALPLLEEAYKLRQAKFGPDHPDTLGSLNNLAGCLHAAGMLDKAMPLYEEGVKLRRAKLGPDHPDTLNSLNNLATGYFAGKKYAEALGLFEEALDLTKAKLGADHPGTLNSMSNLAEAYRKAGQLPLAVRLNEQTLERRRATLGADHPDTATSMNNLAASYRATGKLSQALQWYAESLKVRRVKLGDDHPDTLITMNNLAMSSMDAGRFDDAVPLLEEAVRRKKEVHGADHPGVQLSVANLAVAYCGAKAGEKAVPLFREYLASLREQLPKDDPRLAATLAQAGRQLLGCDQFAAAEEFLREWLTIQQAREPDVWTTFNGQFQLGASLLGQKKYADAEPLLVKGYEGMKAREKAIPPPSAGRVPEALDRLVELYTATEQPDEVKKYMELRAKYPAAKTPDPAPPKK